MPHLKKHCYVKCSEIRYSDLQKSWDLDASSRDIFLFTWSRVSNLYSYSHDVDQYVFWYKYTHSRGGECHILILVSSRMSPLYVLALCCLATTGSYIMLALISVQQLSRFCSSYPSSSTLALAFIIQTLPFLIYE